MTDASVNGLLAVAKSLHDVVRPAVDSQDVLAREQLDLAIDYIVFIADRVNLIRDRERAELAANVGTGERVAKLCESAAVGARGRLDDAVGRGRTVMADPGAGVNDLIAASSAITAELRDIVRDSQVWESTARTLLEQEVLEGAGPTLIVDRAWYLPLGFDPEPATAPSLADALAQALDSPTRSADGEPGEPDAR